ncbi:MAG: hypothetical protein ACREN6_13505, partial [Gemmatimonadaceae bacterium]
MPTMKFARRSALRTAAGSLIPLAIALALAASAGAQGTPDPRVGLKGGLYDAAEASWNLHLVSTTPPAAKFV